MATRVEIAEECQVDDIRRLVLSCGLNVSEDVLEHFFFGVPLSVSRSPIRGGIVVVDDEKGIVGFQGVMPTRIYADRVPFDGYILGITGLVPEFGGWLPELLEKERQVVSSSFGYSNTANAKSSKIARLALGAKAGPQGGAIVRYAITDLFGVVCLALSRKGSAGRLLARCAACLSFPVRKFLRMLHQLGSRRIEVLPADFTSSEWSTFWNEFLSQSKGVMTSRAPDRLQWRFAEGPLAPLIRIIPARSDGRLVGYAILQKSVTNLSGISRLQILDWCAIGNDAGALDGLLCKCVQYAKLSDACMIDYVGAPSREAEEILEHHLSRTRAALANTFLHIGFPSDIQVSLANESSWFFGPYDGDRGL